MTSEADSGEQLPHVTEADLLGMIVDEAADPKLERWWRVFAKENPELARALLDRAVIESDNPETRKKILDTAVYAITALERAAERIETKRHEITE